MTINKTCLRCQGQLICCLYNSQTQLILQLSKSIMVMSRDFETLLMHVVKKVKLQWFSLIMPVKVKYDSDHSESSFEAVFKNA